MVYPSDDFKCIVNVKFDFDLVDASFCRHDAVVKTNNLHENTFIQYTIVSKL